MTQHDDQQSTACMAIDSGPSTAHDQCLRTLHLLQHAQGRASWRGAGSPVSMIHLSKGISCDNTHHACLSSMVESLCAASQSASWHRCWRNSPIGFVAKL